MHPSPFDDLTDVYESMIDWPKRLANEGPFYRRLFEQAAVQRIADVACGTGTFCDLAPQRIVGVDINPDNVSHCKSKGLP